MTEAPVTIVDTITVTDDAALPDPLLAGLTPERRALWSIDRAYWGPRLLLARDGAGNPLGAALTSGRPLTAYRKIVDIIAADDSVFAALLDAASTDAPPVSELRPAPRVAHFEEHLGIDPLDEHRAAALRAAGFVRAADPVPSIPSTRSGDPAQVAAWSKWLGAAPQRLAPYYGQTTDVTCGAVSSLMALELRGAGAFDPESLVENRAGELAFWRRATNLPACEPIGLAVETALSGAASDLFPSLPRVVLSTSEPVLLEEYASDEGERFLRTDLQRESLRRAEELGVVVDRRWIDVDEIAEIVRGGDQVLLLIGLAELIGDPTPHWVLANELIGDALIVSDPWVQAPNGETWVDTFALPIPLSTIDRITRWGDPAYRGIAVLPTASPTMAV